VLTYIKYAPLRFWSFDHSSASSQNCARNRACRAGNWHVFGSRDRFTPECRTSKMGLTIRNQKVLSAVNQAHCQLVFAGF
jgi:hypothetical protein